MDGKRRAPIPAEISSRIRFRYLIVIMPHDENVATLIIRAAIDSRESTDLLSGTDKKISPIPIFSPLYPRY